MSDTQHLDQALLALMTDRADALLGLVRDGEDLAVWSDLASLHVSPSGHTFDMMKTSQG